LVEAKRARIVEPYKSSIVCRGSRHGKKQHPSEGKAPKSLTVKTRGRTRWLRQWLEGEGPFLGVTRREVTRSSWTSCRGGKMWNLERAERQEAAEKRGGTALLGEKMDGVVGTGWRDAKTIGRT